MFAGILKTDPLIPLATAIPVIPARDCVGRELTVRYNLKDYPRTVLTESLRCRLIRCRLMVQTHRPRPLTLTDYAISTTLLGRTIHQQTLVNARATGTNATGLPSPDFPRTFCVDCTQTVSVTATNGFTAGLLRLIPDRIAYGDTSRDCLRRRTLTAAVSRVRPPPRL